MPAALMLLYLVPFLVPLPRAIESRRWAEAAGDLAHVPLLGGLAWVLWLRGPLAGRAWRAAAAALAIGVGIEVLQSWVGRQLSLGDIELDAVGIGLVLAGIGWFRGPRAPAVLLAVLCLATLGWRSSRVAAVWRAEHHAALSFPVLADFEASDAGVLWQSSHGGSLRIAPRADGEGRSLVIAAGPPLAYPGATLFGFPRDWTGYRRIEWDARAVGADSLAYSVRVEDMEIAKDKVFFAERFAAGAQWRHFAWEPNTCFGRATPRPLARRELGCVTFYFYRPAAPVRLEMDNLRLTR